MNSFSGIGPRNMSTGSMRQKPNFRGDIIPKGYRTGQLQQYTPEQLDLFHQLLGNLGPESNLGRFASGDESTFAQMEAPAMRQFSELLGGISNRFATGSGRGSLGTLKSSGFQNTGTAAASNFAQDLAAKRQELQRQALLDMFGLSNMLLNQRPYDRFLVEKPQKEQSSGWGGLIGAGLGAAGGFFAGGPTGALYGANIGYKAGSSF